MMFQLDCEENWKLFIQIKKREREGDLKQRVKISKGTKMDKGTSAQGSVQFGCSLG